MEEPSKPTTVLSLSRGVGYGYLYNPVIGRVKKDEYPMVRPCRKASKKIKLVQTLPTC
jgi:hypothetical protein